MVNNFCKIKPVIYIIFICIFLLFTVLRYQGIAIYDSGLLEGAANFSSVGIEGSVSGITSAETGANSGIVYKLTSIANRTTGKSDSNPPTCIEPFSICSDKSQKVFEMAFMLPEGSEGIKIYTQFWGSVGNTTNTSNEWQFRITNEGFYRAVWSDDARVVPNTEFIYGQWYNLALILPGTTGILSDGSSNYSHIAELYINGEKISDINVEDDTCGIRRIRLTSVTAKPDTDTVYGYIDNLRLHDGSYNSYQDKLPVLTATDNNVLSISDSLININLDRNISLSKFTTYITHNSNTDFYILDDSGNLINSDYEEVKDGSTLIAITTNGQNMERAYRYCRIKYTPETMKDYIFKINVLKDNKPAGMVFDEKTQLTFNIHYTNYSASTHNIALLVTQWKNEKLIDLWAVNKSVSGEFFNDTLSFSPDIKEYEGTSIKAIFYNSDTLTPYTSPINLHYSHADIPSTLYIIGDGGAHSYGDFYYPLQGWGHYIDEFLNYKITVDNRADAGWTTDHYLYPDGVDENGFELYTADGVKKVIDSTKRYKCWNIISEKLKPGDYLMMSFGKYDSGSGNVSKERYLENIKKMYTEAVAIGANVIFLTPTVSGGKWNSTYAFTTYEDNYYTSITKAFAESKNATCLNLDKAQQNLYNSILSQYKTANPNLSDLQCKQYVRAQFHLYAPELCKPISQGGWGLSNNTMDDGLNFNDKGAYRIAGLIAELLTESDSPLGDYVFFPTEYTDYK